MYTITKGPSKLVAQRRTGPPQQQVESRLGELLKCRQPAPPASPPPRAQPLAPQPGPWPLSSPGPRLVFNRVNGRRPLTTSPSLERTQETYTLAHEENVRFVSEVCPVTTQKTAYSQCWPESRVATRPSAGRGCQGSGSA
ncbi:MAPK regulated corepressor interacting protein 2 isoform X4 [Marmota monax]|uniref:MAPK regulated corepressor interacting protein 2 isoform X4 n=1 Tax=Marmota monax TaxID=9995 RepID=UPI001EAF9912|nr:MAPK regulated corepressor interacting protein 2 isoform X4 [Marmota monax]